MLGRLQLRKLVQCFGHSALRQHVGHALEISQNHFEFKRRQLRVDSTVRPFFCALKKCAQFSDTCVIGTWLLSCLVVSKTSQPCPRVKLFVSNTERIFLLGLPIPRITHRPNFLVICVGGGGCCRRSLWVFHSNCLVYMDSRNELQPTINPIQRVLLFANQDLMHRPTKIYCAIPIINAFNRNIAETTVSTLAGSIETGKYGIARSKMSGRIQTTGTDSKKLVGNHLSVRCLARLGETRWKK